MQNNQNSLRSLGEFGLISLLEETLGDAFPAGVVGIGDDCAVFPSGEVGSSFLITTDTMVEGRHFKVEWSLPSLIGWKSLAVSLSDIAAMGGIPKYAVITLQLPKETSTEFVKQLYLGIKEISEIYGVKVIGGDTVSASELAISTTVIGASRNPILRSGAMVEDDIWVSGSVGEAGEGLRFLRSGGSPSNNAAETKNLNHYQKPIPRILVGEHLSKESLASSMIDISDGLLQDLSHIAKKSLVHCVVEADKVPVAESLRNQGEVFKALAAGDDYELLFTADIKNRDKIESLSSSLGTSLTRIGHVLEKHKSGLVSVMVEGETKSLTELLGETGAGYDHFKA